MKKILLMFLVIILIGSLVGCSMDESFTDYDDMVAGENNNDSEYIIDYLDSSAFEDALNNGELVSNKIVRFDVTEYNPKAGVGINCWSGEHLNFISENELDVEKGSIVIGRITEEPVNIFGSWIVYYEVLEIESGKTDNTDDDVITNSNAQSQANKNKKIVVTMSEDELEGLETSDAETKLREMGFTVFKYDTVSAGDRNDLDGKIGAVEIKSWTFGKGDFSKGDTYDMDAIVVLWSYKYTAPEKPVENLTIDNCPDLAAILSDKAQMYQAYSSFALKYKGQNIEFDGHIDYCAKHGNYKTRYDYLVSAGDYDANHQIGPTFKFEDVNYYDLNTNLDTVSVGLNVQIVAKVVSFDSNTGIFYLDPISVKGR